MIAWEAPERIVLSWEIDAQWQSDPNLATEVEVRFIAEDGARTRVELEHRCLERFGEQAEAMVKVFDSPNAWLGILDLLRQRAEQTRP